MKPLKFLAIAIIISVNASAESFGELTSNWLTKNAKSSDEEVQYIGQPTTDPSVPIGDNLLVLTILAGGYMIMQRKRLKVNNSYNKI